MDAPKAGDAEDGQTSGDKKGRKKKVAIQANKPIKKNSQTIFLLK